MKTKISRMVGQLTIPFLILSMLAAISIGAAGASPSVSITPSATTGLNPGNTFSVNVTVDPAGIPVNGVQINLKFDPNVVQLNSVVIGNFLGPNPIPFSNNIDNTNGNLALAYTIQGGNQAVTTPGTFATLNFQVKSNALAGTSNLNLMTAALSNASGNIPGVLRNNGTVTVNSPSGGGGTPSISIIPPATTANQGGTFSVNVTVNPAGISVNGVQISLKFNPNVVQLNSVVIGNFLGNNPIQFSNNIDNTNGNLVLAYTIQGGNPAVTTPGTFATLNFQVKSNAPAGTSTLDLTTAALSNASGNIPGVLANDGTVTVNSPSSGGGGTGTPSISIIPPATTANQGGTFSVNVTVDPAGISVNGVQINLKFDPNVVQLNSVVIGGFLGSSPIQFSNNIDNTNGTLALAYTVQGGNPAVTTPGTFATLNFQAKAVGTSALDLTMAALSNASGNIPGVLTNDGTVTVNPTSITGTPSISIIPSATTANQSDTFSVNVTVDPANNSVNGVQIKLKFDPNVVQLNSVVIGNFLGPNPTQFNNNIDNTNGTLALAYTVQGGNPAVTTLGYFATLNFKVNSNAPAGTSNLDLTMAALSNASGNMPGVLRNNGTVTVNPAFGTIAGNVTDASTNAPISNATVTADGVVANTTTNGSYSISIAPGTYTVTVSATGYIDNTTTGVVVTSNNVTTLNIALTQKPPMEWRFISVPFRLDNSSVDHVLEGIFYDQLYGYDPVGKMFTSPVTKFEPLKGYLIHIQKSKVFNNLTPSSVPSIPPSLPVYKGWNLIGTPGNATLSAETMLKPIDDSYFNIWHWNVPTQMYDIAGINGATGVISPTSEGTDVFNMTPKVSYWVWGTQNTTLPAFSP